MNLYGKIMNIQYPNDIIGVFENDIPDVWKRVYVDAYEFAKYDGKLKEFKKLLMLAYIIGHRNARHAAAELTLLHKIQPDIKKFTCYWLDGTREILEGTSKSDALNNAGYGQGALAALDFIVEGEIDDYTWIKGEPGKQGKWVKKT